MLGHILLLLFLSESYESDLTDDYAVYQAPGGETTLFYCRPDKACTRNSKYYQKKTCARQCDSQPTELITMEKRKNTALKNLFHSTLPLPCSCQSNYRLLDLGHSYFPRYIPTVECQPITCWSPPYSCQEKYYKVKVLRKRDPETEMDFTLPETLRNFWVLESLTVTVACECTS